MVRLETTVPQFDMSMRITTLFLILKSRYYILFIRIYLPYNDRAATYIPKKAEHYIRGVGVNSIPLPTKTLPSITLLQLSHFFFKTAKASFSD